MFIQAPLFCFPCFSFSRKATEYLERKLGLE